MSDERSTVITTRIHCVRMVKDYADIVSALSTTMSANDHVVNAIFEISQKFFLFVKSKTLINRPCRRSRGQLGHDVGEVNNYDTDTRFQRIFSRKRTTLRTELA